MGKEDEQEHHNSIENVQQRQMKFIVLSGWARIIREYWYRKDIMLESGADCGLLLTSGWITSDKDENLSLEEGEKDYECILLLPVKKGIRRDLINNWMGEQGSAKDVNYVRLKLDNVQAKDD